MKKNLLHLTAFFIFLITTSKTQATSIQVAGFITTNTTWSVDTVKVIGDVNVNGAKLTISPGTVIEFQGYYEIETNGGGALQAMGNLNDSVYFTYYDTTLFYDNTIPNGGWRGLELYSGNDSTILSYCSVQFIKNAYDGTLNFYHDWSIFIHNSATQGSRISNCTIRNNHTKISNPVNNANSVLGCWGIIHSNSNSIIRSNKIINNTAGKAALACGGTCIIDRNIISYNTCSFVGGIDVGGSGTPIITNNFVCNNSDEEYINCVNTIGGGAILISQGSNAYLANNVIANNHTVLNGAGIRVVNSNPTIINNDIVNNHAENNQIQNFIPMHGGGICLYNSTPILKNNIIWGNTMGLTGFIVSNQIFLETDNSDPDVINSCIEGGLAGIQNEQFGTYIGNYSNSISTYPNFINPSTGSGIAFDGLTNADWRLQLSSPCINTGTTNALGSLPSVDLWYNPRIAGPTIDIGAYEAPSEFSPNGINDFDNNSNLSIYPNPAANNFNINYSFDYNKATISIVNSLGQTVETRQFSASEKVNFDVSSLAKGVYFVNATFDEKAMSSKLIVQ